jgi:hypothetical protein
MRSASWLRSFFEASFSAHHRWLKKAWRRVKKSFARSSLDPLSILCRSSLDPPGHFGFHSRIRRIAVAMDPLPAAFLPYHVFEIKPTLFIPDSCAPTPFTASLTTSFTLVLQMTTSSLWFNCRPRPPLVPQFSTAFLLNGFACVANYLLRERPK